MMNQHMLAEFFNNCKLTIVSGFLFTVVACQSPTSAAKKMEKVDGSVVATSETSSDKLAIKLASGGSYRFTITNESETEVDANGKTITNLHKSDIAVTYNVQQDSVGNYLLRMYYDKIHLYTKVGDNESEMDAANAPNSINPTEKMLGVLRAANLTASVSPNGKVLAISGYKELGDKILAGLNADVNGQNMAKDQWEKIIGEGMVKKSIQQLFSVLPDSTVKVGNTWKRDMQQTGEINMNVASTFTLKDMEDGIASIESEGRMTSNKGESTIMGYPVSSDLHGDQQGEYKVDTETGMVLKNNTTSKLKGTLQVMGKEIPIRVTSTLKMNGKKISSK